VTAQLGRTIPALPVRDVPAAVAHYRERFGFDAPHVEGGFAIVRRDRELPHRRAGRRCAVRRGSGALHRASQSGVTKTDFGTREFHTVDLDGNLLTFFRRE